MIRYNVIQIQRKGIRWIPHRAVIQIQEPNGDACRGEGLRHGSIGRCDMTTEQADRKKPDDLQHDDCGRPHAREKSKKDLDKELDKALSASFPSSDPPAASQPTSTEPAGDPKVKP
jgi:hypothetical protein